MSSQSSEPSALTIWFNRQRRAWWRVNWWMLVILLLLWLLTPFGLSALMAFVRPVGYLIYQSGTQWFWYLPWIYLLILLIAAWMVARLGANYSIPDDLLLASSPRDCSRAFIAILRRDVYLILGGGVFLPFLVLQFFRTGVNPGEIFIFALTLGGAAALLSELSIYLRVTRRRVQVLFHTFTPSVIVATGYFLIPLLLIVLARQARIDDLNDSINMMVVIPLVSLVALVVAWVFYRLSYSPRISNDSWRKQ